MSSIDDDLLDPLNDGFNESMYKEEDIMVTMEPGPRIFMLRNEVGTTLLGFVLSETDDSFLVALPSRLIDKEGEKVIEAFINVPFLRLLKSAVSMVIPPFADFKECFDKYLAESGALRYPDMAEDIGVYLSHASPEPADEVLTQEEFEARQKAEEELTKKLDEAYAQGSVFPEISSTKH